MTKKTDVYLEVGSKRVFAGAIDWPGWCRSGRNETEAMENLFSYGPRYASVLTGTRLGFTTPKDPAQLVVVERLRGTSTTDFGAPSVAPTVDRDRSCSAADIKRFNTILRALWRAFDRAVESARGEQLAKGPRGGGRSLDAIVEHVIGADANYLSAVGWKAPKGGDAPLTATRKAIREAIDASAAGEIPLRGPRGGKRWTARYFVRRVAWHVVAHVWEIERRLADSS
jgi:hypothetical protein